MKRKGLEQRTGLAGARREAARGGVADLEGEIVAWYLDLSEGAVRPIGVGLLESGRKSRRGL